MVSQKIPLRKDNSNTITGQWTIIGAGPAGIAAVGKLLDSGINPSDIIWLDPNFKVGDFGQKWRSVSSNTRVKLFQDFLKSCPAFQYSKSPIAFPINNLAPNDTCLLEKMVDPLQWISDHLHQKVKSIPTMVSEIILQDGQWIISTKVIDIITKNVILAIGAEPLCLNLPNLTSIPIDEVVDLERLRKICSSTDTIAVFGSSHTAVVALYNLTAIGAKIINFYRSPLKYAVFYDDWVLYDNTGLKGYSAQWAQDNLENNLASNIERVHIDDPLYDQAIAKCNKVIYAIGFERRRSITIAPYTDLRYNPNTGIIAPGLFGLGIAFPQGCYDRFGNYELQVGLWKFMSYLNNVLPLWLRTQ